MSEKRIKSIDKEIINSIDEKIIEIEGKELLEKTEKSTTTKEELLLQKEVIETWIAKENTRHTARLATLTAEKTIINTKLALFNKISII